MKQTTVNADLEVVYQPHPPEHSREPEAAHEVPGRPVVDHVRLLWDHRRFLLRMAAWGFAAAVLIALLIPARYESTTRLMPPDDQEGSALGMAAALSGRMGGGVGALAGDLLGLKSSGDLFVGILWSRTVQDDLITKFDLRKVYSVRRWEAARRRLAASSVITADRKSGIITIAVSDQSPERAASLAREYVTELNTVVNQLSTSSARRERVFLEERLQQVKQDMETAEKEFSEFASKNAAIDIKEQGKSMVDSAARLQGEMIATQSELEGLKQIYTDNNVRVRSLRARIAELNDQLQKLGGKGDVLSNLGEPSDGSQYPSIRKLPLLGVPYADLYRQTKVQEAVLEALTQEYEMAKVAEAKEVPSVKVLDPADVPEQKTFPPRANIVFIGVFLSVLLGAAWVLTDARWERAHPQDPAKVLVQDVLREIRSHVPWVGSNGTQAAGSGFARWKRRPSQTDGKDAEPVTPEMRHAGLSAGSMDMDSDGNA